ncbi:putative arsenite efflux transporter protein [Botrytis fragariae]|uniref:Putative arsenite efflux transporter protein n=1 Tax=Botrytis fragariae TaxID=1964551 RepID=A0A8H6B3A4_9HELO|nr:putative arsenite efflux transporter protein [Botrytis fragariae]KAF5878380.1 putative arsenite efflux transporter protein [Botrytis fragariae]
MTKVLASEDIASPESMNKFPKSSSDVPSHSIDIEKNSHLQVPPEPRDDFQTDHPKTSLFKSLGWLDRLLALWIFLAMAIGILLGNFVPNVGTALQKGEFVGVSVPIAVCLLAMMYPILCKVKFETLHLVFQKKDIWVQIGFSLVVNWIVAPLLMLALAWAFLPDKEELRSGLILVGIARCIAMVLIWTGLAGGSTSYCAILSIANGSLCPLSVLFISVISGAEGPAEFSYSTIASSVAVFLGIPLAAAILTRFLLRRLTSPSWYDTVFLKYLSPLSLLGLLATILILFASQGQHVIQQIVSVVRVAAPLIVYFAIIFFLTLFVCARMGFGYKVATTQSFTAASNNFELAIAVAVATYGADSEQALAATVGPLIEVPVLLGLVYVVRWIGERRGWKD